MPRPTAIFPADAIRVSKFVGHPDFSMEAVGNKIQTWVNDVPVADTVDDKTEHKSGFIGLQVHGIEKGKGPFEVRWRNIQIKEVK